MPSPKDFDPKYDDTGIEYFSIPSFTFVSGVKKPVKIAYRSFNPSGKKTALIPTCYGGRINDTLNFTSGALKDYHVIVVAMLGNGESSAPSNYSEFPADYSLRYQDCINSQYKLVTEHFGLKSLDAVIGFSMGGQQAYYWAVMHGSGEEPFVKNVVPICGSAKTSGHSEYFDRLSVGSSDEIEFTTLRRNEIEADCLNVLSNSADLKTDYAFLEGPIAALTTSYDYDGGKYRKNGLTTPVQGMRAFGRAYAAWLTSPEWFRQELWRSEGTASLKDWLHPPEGESGFEKWDAEDVGALLSLLCRNVD